MQREDLDRDGRATPLAANKTDLMPKVMIAALQRKEFRTAERAGRRQKRRRSNAAIFWCPCASIHISYSVRVDVAALRDLGLILLCVGDVFLDREVAAAARDDRGSAAVFELVAVYVGVVDRGVASAGRGDLDRGVGALDKAVALRLHFGREPRAVALARRAYDRLAVDVAEVAIFRAHKARRRKGQSAVGRAVERRAAEEDVGGVQARVLRFQRRRALGDRGIELDGARRLVIVGDR